MVKSHLVVSAEASDFLARLRPELIHVFEPFGSHSCIAIAKLLRPASNPPPEQFIQGSGLRFPRPIHSEPEARDQEPILALGDLLASFLHRIRVDAIVALLQRRGWLRGCQCAARQARLNALSPRLRVLLEPLPETLVMILAWLLFAGTLLLR